MPIFAYFSLQSGSSIVTGQTKTGHATRGWTAYSRWVAYSQIGQLSMISYRVRQSASQIQEKSGDGSDGVGRTEKRVDSMQEMQDARNYRNLREIVRKISSVAEKSTFVKRAGYQSEVVEREMERSFRIKPRRCLPGARRASPNAETFVHLFASRCRETHESRCLRRPKPHDSRLALQILQETRINIALRAREVTQP